MSSTEPAAPDVSPEVLDAFLARWDGSGGAERANYGLFLPELCDVLGVPRPEPTRPDGGGDYVFERDVVLTEADGTASRGRIDLYRRGCFVLETKQGVDAPAAAPALGAAAPRKKGHGTRQTPGWDEMMMRARAQAERYARHLPPADGWPPFLVVVDVGYSFELFADFTRSGRTYQAFPDARRHRVFLADLRDPEVRDRLRRVWLDPLSLDEGRRGAKVTREVSETLARLARSLEESGHEAHRVARFLMRCLFTMFAEDVGLIPENRFRDRLAELRDRREVSLFADEVRSLWEAMAGGGYSPILRAHVQRFNGGLFEDPDALLLTPAQLDVLIAAANAQWKDVEPAIFGTLLERALDERERHALGAHFTPKAYVERLVLPTIIEPLRAQWGDAQAAAVAAEGAGDRERAVAALRGFLRTLCDTTVLDPACGTGNFLYVTMEHMKRLEGEVWDRLRGLGETQTFEGFGLTVDPHQFLGLELNPRAAAIADLVLWIGFLRWQLRHVSPPLPEPILRKFENIQCRDAVLASGPPEPLADAEGRPVTRWDGHSTRPHPVTGEPVPDETCRVPVVRYPDPTKAAWPEADYIVGNPPFLGAGMLRQSLGDGYAEALREAHDDVPDSADYVAYWWNHAAQLARTGKVRRFGLITTNSLRQTFNRRVLQAHLDAADPPLSLRFAIPDHPWVEATDGAAVRIAMTVGEAGNAAGLLQRVTEERQGSETLEVGLASSSGRIMADLTIGADVAGTVTLAANQNLCSMGVKLHGSGFVVSPEEARSLGLGQEPGLEQHIRPYVNGRDLNQRSRSVLVIDLLGLTAEEVRVRFPAVYQWVLERVRPEREQNNRATYRNNWWIFGEPRRDFRPAMRDVSRFISTSETSKHRFFVFLDSSILPDNMLVNIALDDAYYLGVLSSRVHVTWALAAGGRLGVGNDPRYNKTRCFDPFPFPDGSPEQAARIRELGEALDAHRKRQQAQHPELTLTGMYNVLAKLRAGEGLSAKERAVHEQGLVSVLRQLHDDLDAAVAAAYGWPADLPDGAILERLVALNRERAAEEAAGHVRWLRPAFQDPTGAAARPRPAQAALPMGGDEPAPAAAAGAAPIARRPWPKEWVERVQALREALAARGAPGTPEDLARAFHRANRNEVKEMLRGMAVVGLARALDDGRFAPA
jgi:hypothetical protein